MVPCFLQPHITEWSMHLSVFRCMWDLSKVSLCGRSVYSLELKFPANWLKLILIRTCVIYPGWKISGVQRWGEDAISSSRQTVLFGWEAGMGSRHVLWANWLGTTPGWEQFVVRYSLVTSRMSLSHSKLSYTMKKLVTSFSYFQSYTFWYLLTSWPISSWKKPWG